MICPVCEQVEKFRATLQWYADPANYKDGVCGCHPCNEVSPEVSKRWVRDCGARARAALKDAGSDSDALREAQEANKWLRAQNADLAAKRYHAEVRIATLEAERDSLKMLLESSDEARTKQ